MNQNQKKIPISSPFLHLQQTSHVNNALEQVAIDNDKLPGSVIRLGHYYRRNVIMGSNARCIAFLEVLKDVIQNWYKSPTDKSLTIDFLKKIEPMIDYLNNCRPLSISMGNTLTLMKMQIGLLNPNLSQKEKKKDIINIIDSFMTTINLATEQIASAAADRIRNGDVIMTYARSQSVEKAILLANETKKQFRVIVVDSAPKFEGKEMMARLSNAGIQCTYVMVNAISLMCREVTKFMVGAHGMFSNGVLMSRVGTASCAMVANYFNIPVIVCCETYKFSKKVQLKAITKNELADPRELIPKEKYENWKQNKNLDVLNLVYDITPMEYIDMVITEMGCLPPTSIPVILREQNIFK